MDKTPQKSPHVTDGRDVRSRTRQPVHKRPHRRSRRNAYGNAELSSQVTMPEAAGLPRKISVAPGTETTHREVSVDAHAPHVVGDSASERFDASDVFTPRPKCLPPALATCYGGSEQHCSRQMRVVDRDRSPAFGYTPGRGRLTSLHLSVARVNPRPSNRSVTHHPAPIRNGSSGPSQSECHLCQACGGTRQLAAVYVGWW